MGAISGRLRRHVNEVWHSDKPMTTLKCCLINDAIDVVDELEVENDLLREKVRELESDLECEREGTSYMVEDNKSMCSEIERRLSEQRKLNAENAKLRELVKSMYYDLTNMTFPPDWVTDYEADMRELGIGVDG